MRERRDNIGTGGGQGEKNRKDFVGSSIGLRHNGR
jgi:hypothetical protein